MVGGGRGGIFNLATHEKMTKRLLSTACHMDDELFLFRPTVGLSNQLTIQPTNQTTNSRPHSYLGYHPYKTSFCFCCCCHCCILMPSVCVTNLKRKLNLGQLRCLPTIPFESEMATACSFKGVTCIVSTSLFVVTALKCVGKIQKKKFIQSSVLGPHNHFVFNFKIAKYFIRNWAYLINEYAIYRDHY